MVSIEAASFEVANCLAGPKGPMIEIKDKSEQVHPSSSSYLIVGVLCTWSSRGHGYKFMQDNIWPVSEAFLPGINLNGKGPTARQSAILLMSILEIYITSTTYP